MSLDGRRDAAVARSGCGADARQRGRRPADDEGEAPWHDQTMPIAERMKLAEGRAVAPAHDGGDGAAGLRPVRLQLQDYSKAIFDEEEERLNLCVPGGKETARMLKTLFEEIGKEAAAIARAAAACVRRTARGDPAARATIRSIATFLSRTLLNKPGSEKETWHVEFDLAACGLDYIVGDSFGFSRQMIRLWLTRSSSRSARRRIFRSAAARLREVLTDGVSLSPAPDMLFQLFSYITGGERRKKAKALASAKIRMAMRPRSTCWRRWRNSPACVPTRKPSSKRSIRCSRGFIRFRRRPRSIRAGSSLTVDTVRYDIGGRDAARRRLDLSRRAHRARRRAEGLCAEARMIRPAGRSGCADHHDRSGHRRRAVPRFPAGAHGNQSAGPQLAVLRPPAQRLRLLLRG